MALRYCLNDLNVYRIEEGLPPRPLSWYLPESDTTHITPTTTTGNILGPDDSHMIDKGLDFIITGNTIITNTSATTNPTTTTHFVRKNSLKYSKSRHSIGHDRQSSLTGSEYTTDEQFFDAVDDEDDEYEEEVEGDEEEEEDDDDEDEEEAEEEDDEENEIEVDMQEHTSIPIDIEVSDDSIEELTVNSIDSISVHLEQEQPTLIIPKPEQIIVHEANETSSSTTSSPFPLMAPSNTNTTESSMPKDSTDVMTAVLKRRRTLPARATESEQGFLGILRKNVGKDLSTISMPISLNEPLNLLQKMAEELEYSELLKKASQSQGLERMIFITAFAISGYASTVQRAGKKPFNPLLGETYELIRPDKDFKFISEKVSHHPPIMACHAISSMYSFSETSSVKTKFWGKSMELIPSGKTILTFEPNSELNLPSEQYSWEKVTTCMRNIISGTRYLEHYGDMIIVNNRTGWKSLIKFKESSYFSASKNEISGKIVNEQNLSLIHLCGRWDEALYTFQESEPNKLEVIWRAIPIEGDGCGYGFTRFAIELNEITDMEKGRDGNLIIPRTDTRLRSDQQLYEQVDFMIKTLYIFFFSFLFFLFFFEQVYLIILSFF